MTRPSVSSMALAAVTLVLAPALLVLGMTDLPSATEVRDAHTADLLGVWIITWGLIGLGAVAAITVAFLVWTADAAAARLEQAAARNASQVGDPPAPRLSEALHTNR